MRAILYCMVHGTNSSHESRDCKLLRALFEDFLAYKYGTGREIDGLCRTDALQRPEGSQRQQVYPGDSASWGRVRPLPPRPPHGRGPGPAYQPGCCPEGRDLEDGYSSFGGRRRGRGGNYPPPNHQAESFSDDGHPRHAGYAHPPNRYFYGGAQDDRWGSSSWGISEQQQHYPDPYGYGLTAQGEGFGESSFGDSSGGYSSGYPSAGGGFHHREHAGHGTGDSGFYQGGFSPAGPDAFQPVHYAEPYGTSPQQQDQLDRPRALRKAGELEDGYGRRVEDSFLRGGMAVMPREQEVEPLVGGEQRNAELLGNTAGENEVCGAGEEPGASPLSATFGGSGGGPDAQPPVPPTSRVSSPADDGLSAAAAEEVAIVPTAVAGVAGATATLPVAIESSGDDAIPAGGAGEVNATPTAVTTAGGTAEQLPGVDDGDGIYNSHGEMGASSFPFDLGIGEELVLLEEPFDPGIGEELVLLEDPASESDGGGESNGKGSSSSNSSSSNSGSDGETFVGWDGARKYPFDRGKRSPRSAGTGGTAVLGVARPFDRGKNLGVLAVDGDGARQGFGAGSVVFRGDMVTNSSAIY